jgi:hypothetical protein
MIHHVSVRDFNELIFLCSTGLGCSRVICSGIVRQTDSDARHRQIQ